MKIIYDNLRQEVHYLTGFFGEVELRSHSELEIALNNLDPARTINRRPCVISGIKTLQMHGGEPKIRVDRIDPHNYPDDDKPAYYALDSTLLQIVYRVLRGKIVKRFEREIKIEKQEEDEKGTLMQLLAKHGVPADFNLDTND